MSQEISHSCALQVAQQAVDALISWAKHAPSLNSYSDASPAVQRAKAILGWKDAQLGMLQLLFDRVHLEQSHDSSHYLPLTVIADQDPQIPYPLTAPPSKDLANYKQEILNLKDSIQNNWENLTFLSLVLEKYGSCLGFSTLNEQGVGDVALPDLARITGAVAAAIAHQPDAEQLSLVAGDLSGIQSFIYTISSDGALKSLRARSFYLELVTEEVVQQLLSVLDLPRTSVIYAGGGNFYLLAPDGVAETVKTKCQELNRWLRKEFQSKVFLAIAPQTCDVEDVATIAFTKTWQTAIENVNRQKTQRLAEESEGAITDIFKPKESHTPCKVCHRTDENNLQPLNHLEPDSVLACSTCRNMFALGGELLKTKKLVRSNKAHLSADPLCFKLESGTVYYHLFEYKKHIDLKEDTLFLINNWKISDYERFNTLPLLLGNYGKQTEEPEESGFMSASEFAETSEGIKRVGYLRMDVDRLGQVFAKGLGDHYSLPKLAGLSRQMSYFFKIYLNSLAKDRNKNFLQTSSDYPFKALTSSDRKKLLFIYAGGDDLFISGSWNEVVEFAFDVYQSFRAYTGHNPDITLSGGISLELPKFPLYQAAESAGEAEDKAKGNGRDSLSLFETTFKWSEWLGTVSLEELSTATKHYLLSSDRPPFFGIWNFVDLLQGQLANGYKRSFVRNLLLTAQIQEQQLKEKKHAIEQYRKEHPSAKEEDTEMDAMRQETQDIRYYLHLPKVAYTLARLPSELRQKDEFKPMRISLLSPYNAPYFRAIATWIELLTRNA